MSAVWPSDLGRSVDGLEVFNLAKAMSAQTRNGRVATTDEARTAMTQGERYAAGETGQEVIRYEDRRG